MIKKYMSTLITRLHTRMFMGLIITLMACSRPANVPAKVAPKLLSSEQILMLIDDLAVQPTEGMNFHVLYKEYLNDSSWVLMVLQNLRPGSERFGLCGVLEYHNSNVFVYSDGICNSQLRAELKLKDDGWPFETDGNSHLLLAELRNGLLGYYTLKRPFRFDENKSDTTELNLF